MSYLIKRTDKRDNFLPSLFNFGGDLVNRFFNEDLPATNVSENKKEYKLELEIPGFDKEDIAIEIDNNVLKISAKKEFRQEEKDEQEKILRQEFSSTSFSRSFALPDNVDTENIAANQKHGILNVVLPKKDKAVEEKVKKIEIK
ncbi:MAG: Hsp20/alpha crystallin family protein [Dysgonomonas sp.]